MTNIGKRYIDNPILILVLIIFSIFSGIAIGIEYDTDRTLIPANAEWRYQVKIGALNPNWHGLKFNDSSWKRGKPGFGYGDDDDRTYLKSMRGKFDSVKIRHQFTVYPEEIIPKLYLYIRYDDAFIAYLNGQEVVRSNIKGNSSERTINHHEARKFELFIIDQPDQYLQEGVNILALEGFNNSLNSSDFSLHPILTKKESKNPQLPVSLPREDRLSDLNYLEQRLEDQSSYLLLNKFDYKKSLHELRSKPESNFETFEFARSLQKIIAQIGDSHAKVKISLDSDNDRYLPFIIADSSDGIIAIKKSHSELLSNEHPFIKTIDGKSIDYWLDIASRYIEQGSPQLIRSKSLRLLRSFDHIRTESRVSKTDYITVTLQSLRGKKSIKKKLKTSRIKLRSGKVILEDSRILKGNIGYLRIPSMSSSGVKKIISNMSIFRKTNGLIIDVRSNRGGRYEILRALYGYFLPKNTPPYVTNIAAYRLSSIFKHDHLHYRPTYRMQNNKWSKSERKAIELSIEKFKPEWPLPKDKFSAWHFMILGKSGNPAQYHYNKPVVVLSNAESFSATDGFLSAFSDLPNVTVIGQASAGGSGATQSFILPNSNIQIKLSSMASFRPNGMLFDGNGINVDIPIMPAPEDFLGHSDRVLEKAIDFILQANELVHLKHRH